MTIKKFREFLSEEWLVVDKEKNCVISKHGEDEKGATIAGRKLDFINWNKTHKLGRFGILATHGPQMAMDKPDQFAKAGDKKKKKPGYQGQASRQEGSREESYRREKASGQNSRSKQGRSRNTNWWLDRQTYGQDVQGRDRDKRTISRHSRKLYQ